MSSFLPVNEDHLKEKDIIKNELFRQDVKHEWKVGDSPLNEFKTEFLATMSFPTLFPDGKGDPTNYSTVRNISDSDTEAFALKLKHFIRFGERINGKWVFRFTSHPRFAYWAYNILYRKHILSKGNFFVKQNPGKANLTTSDLQDLWQSNTYSSLMGKLMHYAKNITGTNAYWARIKEDLKTTIKKVGAPTVFFTLSCADFHWPEFHSMFSEDFPFTGSAELRDNVINNPHILDWLFTKRTESFVKWWLFKSLGASWHWYRYEFVLQRGSIHCHGLAKLKNDPGLCEISQLALKGFLAKESLNNDTIAHSEEEILQLKSSIQCGLKAEETICRYVDSLVTTINPNHPDKHSWVRPNVHPCKNRFSEIPVEQQHADYNDLVNCVQRHTNCSSAYCLRKDDKGPQSCGFKYPIDECNESRVQSEKITMKDGAERYRSVVVLREMIPD